VGRRAGALALTAALAAAVPGAPGIGDSYFPSFGNGGYFVSNYDLSLRYNPNTDWLIGTAVITARTNQDLSSFNLDFIGMSVKDITVDDARPAGPATATWHRTSRELTVVPDEALTKGEDFVVKVRYSGVPRTLGSWFEPKGVIPTDDGMLTAGKPQSAATWFPANEHPVDKASYTFRVKVPSQYQVVANGVPAGKTTADGWTTSVWNAPPMASYLATVDVGKWTITDRTTASGIRIIDAVDPQAATDAKPTLDREEEMLDFLASQFGPYPFTTAGSIVDDQFAFLALATQTRPIFSSVFFEPFPPEAGVDDFNPGDQLVLHALAQQWFGDSVSPNRWKDNWLSEGFATYAEWLWMEHEGTPDAPAIMTDLIFGSFGSEPGFWQHHVGDPGPTQLDSYDLSYRGAMTLQALRKRVGDAHFFTILRKWAADHQGGHGTTAQLIALSEQVTGRDLSALFKNWLYSSKKPAAPPYTFTPPPWPAASARGTAPDTTAERAWLKAFEYRHSHPRP
jgi:aminopeptidase N